jgi:hypothetical protein
VSGSLKFHDILMGYSESGPNRNITLMRYAGRCIGCGVRVHVVPSAFDRLRDGDSDPALACEKCWQNTAGIERLMADG